MTKINKHHHLDEPINLLLNTLQSLLEQTEFSREDISPEKLQRISHLYDIFCNSMEQAKQKKIKLEHEFYESAAMLIDNILIMRASEPFMQKAQKTDLLQKFTVIVLMIYDAVYKSEFVVKALGKVPHVSQKLAKVTGVAEANQVLDELWEKIAKAEKASDLADKKLSKTIAKIQDLHDANIAEFPEKLMEEFRSVSLESYAIGAAATLALEELELVKENLKKLQQEIIH